MYAPSSSSRWNIRTFAAFFILVLLSIRSAGSQYEKKVSGDDKQLDQGAIELYCEIKKEMSSIVSGSRELPTGDWRSPLVQKIIRASKLKLRLERVADPDTGTEIIENADSVFFCGQFLLDTLKESRPEQWSEASWQALCALVLMSKQVGAGSSLLETRIAIKWMQEAAAIGSKMYVGSSTAQDYERESKTLITVIAGIGCDDLFELSNKITDELVGMGNIMLSDASKVKQFVVLTPNGGVDPLVASWTAAEQRELTQILDKTIRAWRDGATQDEIEVMLQAASPAVRSMVVTVPEMLAEARRVGGQIRDLRNLIGQESPTN